MSAMRQFCTFRLHGLFLGIEVHRVQEVLRDQGMTPVPLASPVIEGLINLRGQIVTAIDLRRRFGLPDRTRERPPMNVVVRTDDGIASLLVDEIGDVLEVEETSFETTPVTVRGTIRELIHGVHKLDGQLLLWLDVAAVLDFDASAAPALAGGAPDPARGL